MFILLFIDTVWRTFEPN